MRERVQLALGDLRVGAAASGGTRIRARLPLAIGPANRQ
jgi:signal transduction histidine kinase